MKRLFLYAAASAAAVLLLLAVTVIAGLPSREAVRALAKKAPETTALMEQREAEARATKRPYHPVRTWVPLSRVSRNLVQAVVASEDQRFFEHAGVDWAAVRESFEENVEAGRAARGGSTITQQLAKNLFFGTRKTLLRKVRELVVARWLEDDLSKPRILELYLNVIEWGDGTWGCEAAARHWYGVPASALDRRQAAGLAAMIPNPRRINPRVSPDGHERLTRRVLWLMDLGKSIAQEVAGLGADPPPEAPTTVAPPPDIDFSALALDEEETSATPAPEGPEASPAMDTAPAEPPPGQPGATSPVPAEPEPDRDEAPPGTGSPEAAAPPGPAPPP